MSKLVFVSLLLFASSTASAEPEDRRRFSGRRLAVEIVGGEVIGALATGITFNALCNGRDCLGSAIAAFSANLAITPLGVWGIGEMMGGDGSLGYSYLGASIALAPFSVTGSPDESPSDTMTRLQIETWTSSILLAPCSALMYEVSSHLRWSREHAVSLAVRTLRNDGELDGAIGTLRGTW
jgi:hypothetical protein